MQALRPFWTRQLVLIALFGFALRLAFSLGYWVDKPLTHDEQEYLQLAGNLLAGEGLVYSDGRNDHFGRAPGYPAFLSILLWLHDRVLSS